MSATKRGRGCIHVPHILIFFVGGFSQFLPPIEEEYNVAVACPMIKCRDEIEGIYTREKQGERETCVRGDYWLVTKVRRWKIKREGTWRSESEGREKKGKPGR